MEKVQILSKYLPGEAPAVISRWIDYFDCEFRISRSRNSKFGDFRPACNGQPDRISVNYNLNPYAFLVTTVHEFAHLLTWREHKSRVKPHGSEWKHNFKRLMKPFFERKVFPADLHSVLLAYLQNPAASSCNDLTLFRALKEYDEQTTGMSTVEKLPLSTLFALKDGRVFRKETLLRKRYRCLEISTGRVFLFNPLAEVIPVSGQTA